MFDDESVCTKQLSKYTQAYKCTYTCKVDFLYHQYR